MKNRKLIKTVAATIVCSAMAITAFSFAACDGDKGDPATPHYHTYSTGDDWAHNDAYHWRYATCEHEELTAYKAAHDWGDDDICDTCGATKAIIKPTMSEADEPAVEVNEDGTVNVKYEFTTSDYEAKTLDSNLVSGIYTVLAGSTIQSKTPVTLYNPEDSSKTPVPYTKSVKIGTANDIVVINAPAAGTLVMHVANGSGSVKADQLNLTDPDSGVTVISYYAEGSSGPLVEYKIEFPKGGEYRITRKGGTSDIYYMCYTAKVENSPVESISVASGGTVNYFVGQEFSTEGLAVNATTESGRISPVDSRRLEIDHTAFDNSKAGVYKINVSYEKEEKTYATSYYVNVYSYDSLTLGTDKIVKESTNSAAGNGVYANHSLRQFYFVGETLDTDGISVALKGSLNNDEMSFLLKDAQYTVSDVDMSTPGKKTVTVTVKTNKITKTETFEIYVAAKDASLATATSVDLAVSASTSDANIGVKNSSGAYQFKTIHQALEFLENSGVPDNAQKTINLAAGTYWEKLEVNVPNLTIIGEDRDTTKIEYDALYGARDASGFEHVTDSTATLNVRDKAVNFTIKGVTVSNYYNTAESYTGAPSTDRRALAILIMSDNFVMDDCALLGYQDTIELFTGRQLITNTYIAGTTDFIFGTNNTTYFYNCEIHSITSGKSTEGGYITAFKGCNKGSADAVTYGAIFDNCHFTADEGVSGTAIGRTWGEYAAVAVINSEIDGHVSTTTSSFGAGDRYVNMSVKPDAATVKFVEYNNTGDGAINQTIAGMTYLTADEAKNYSDFSVIFGTTNGGVTYNSVWMPVLPGVETHTVTVYTKEGEKLGELQVAGGASLLEEQIKALVTENETYKAYDIVGIYSDNEGTEYTYPEISADGSVYVELHFEKAIVSSTTINFKSGANYADLVASGKLEITTPEGKDSPYMEVKGDCIGFYEGAEISLEVKAGTTIIVTAYGGGYTNYTVKIDGVLKTDLTGADSETGVLTGDVEFAVAGNCTVTLVCGSSASLAGANYLKSLAVEVPHTYANGETINFLEYDGAVLQGGATGKWNGIIITTDNGGKFSSRLPDNQDIQCNPGTVFTFNVDEGVTAEDIIVVDYNGNKDAVKDGVWTVAVNDGVATVTCVGTDGNRQYIKGIEIL